MLTLVNNFTTNDSLKEPIQPLNVLLPNLPELAIKQYHPSFVYKKTSLIGINELLPKIVRIIGFKSIQLERTDQS